MKDRGRLSEPQEHALRLERREDDAVGLLTRAFADIGCSRGSADQRWRCVAAPTRAERTHARSRWPVPAPGRARGHRPGSTGLGPAGTRARRAAQAARGSGAIRCGLGSGDRSGCRHSAALPGAPVVSRHVRPSVSRDPRATGPRSLERPRRGTGFPGSCQGRTVDWMSSSTPRIGQGFWLNGYAGPDHLTTPSRCCSRTAPTARETRLELLEDRIPVPKGHDVKGEKLFVGGDPRALAAALPADSTTTFTSGTACGH